MLAFHPSTPATGAVGGISTARTPTPMLNDMDMPTTFTPLPLSSSSNANLSSAMMSSLTWLSSRLLKKNPKTPSPSSLSIQHDSSAGNMPSSSATCQGNQSNLSWCATLNLDDSMLEDLPALTAEDIDAAAAAADQMGVTAPPPLPDTITDTAASARHGDEQQKEDLNLMPQQQPQLLSPPPLRRNQQQQQQQQQPSKTKNKNNKNKKNRHPIGRCPLNKPLHEKEIAFFVEVKTLFEMNHPFEDFHLVCSGKGNKGSAILENLYNDVKKEGDDI